MLISHNNITNFKPVEARTDYIVFQPIKLTHPHPTLSSATSLPATGMTRSVFKVSRQ